MYSVPGKYNTTEVFIMNHKIGYIGFGEMASNYHYQVANDRKDTCPTIEPYAVFDIRQSQRDLATERGLLAFDNLADFLASDVDIVVVATPNHLHKPYTCAALKAGKHVICEKPATLSPALFEEMVACSKETGKLLCVHQNRRFDRDFILVKKLLEENRIGKPFMIASRVQGDLHGELWDWRGFPDQGGGWLRDWGVHLLDQVVYLANEPVKSVSAVCRKIRNELCDDYDKIDILFESGLAAEVEVSTHTTFDLPRWVVYADEGQLMVDRTYDKHVLVKEFHRPHPNTKPALTYTIDSVVPKTLLHRGEDSIVNKYQYPEKDEDIITQDWAYLYKNIIDSIDGKDELIVKPEQVMTVLRIIEAAEKSSANDGETIRF